MRPNLVLIVLDDLGFSDLGCYGSEIATPNMDRLAAGGLRYSNFHATAMCSPTRASLLTGRHHHSVGMGIIAEWSTDHPGYTGRITPRAATIAEQLQPAGYGCYAIGKWHVMPQSEVTPAGPFQSWPLARGFDRWFGFHGALTDSWYPELYEDNHALDHDHDGTTHLSEMLVDRAASYLRDHWVGRPDDPFLLYLAFGAPHWPHQVATDVIDKYVGRYDEGWDAIREGRLERQISLGIVPPDTRMAPLNEGVVPWKSLSAEEQRLFARMQEVYAAFVEHTDAQIGRVIDELERTDQLDNTLFIVLSDNGASPEGGPAGAVNARRELLYQQDSMDERLAAIDSLGSARTYNHYPWGWAQVSNTPLKWYKKDVHGGGVRAPLLVHWPARVPRCQIRTQYHHVTDIVPTVLELLDIKAATHRNGHEEMPLHGTSMVYSFDQAEAPTRKQNQYYELLGDRAYWENGWKAVTRHNRGVPYDEDRWELYHLDRDFSETQDLADEHPEVLEDLKRKWVRAAEAYDVLPMDDREYERNAEGIAKRARASSTFYADASRLDRFHVPDLTGRSYTITARVRQAGNADGVLLAIGSAFAGLSLYLKGGRPVVEYVYSERERHLMEAGSTLPDGPVDVVLGFARNTEGGGTFSLAAGDEHLGSLDVDRTWPVAGLAGGMHCGRDGASAVSQYYTAPHRFTGILDWVRVDLDSISPRDVAVDSAAALADQ